MAEPVALAGTFNWPAWGDAYQTAWLDTMVKGHIEALDKLDSQLIPAATVGKVL